MTKINNSLRHILKALVITLLISTTISAGRSAQTGSPEDSIRDDMLLIAERYTTHQWTATEANIRHNTDNIHTPDMQWCITNLARSEGCWSIGSNIGVSYRWNGSTPIDDSDLGLYRLTEGMEVGNGYFREKIAAGKAAGDITTEYVNGVQQVSSTANTAGVDCVGFINNVWRLGTRAGTSATSGNTLAIRFENLRRGDILMRFTQDGQDHVVLFSEFVFDEPGITKVKVYESSVGYKKVTESIWKIIGQEEYLNGKTHKVTMERVQVKLGGIFVEGDHLILDNFIPRTLFQPRDIVLVIDRSGSMGLENRIAQAKESAKMLIDFMRPGDRIGIITFAGTAMQLYPPPGQPLTIGEIDLAGAVKNAAKLSLATITLGSDGTTIGGGLRLGQQLLNTSDSENRTQIMVLISDGEEISAPFWNTVKPEITVPVSVMAIGTTAQVTLEIAMWTNGSWYGHTSGFWVNHLFQSISANTYREDIIKEVKSQVPSGGTVEETVLIDSTVGSATFSLAWPGSDLDLIPVQPDGSVITPAVAETDPNIEFVSGATYEFYKIFAPQKGAWTLRVFGKSTSGPVEDYSIVASAADAMILSADTDKKEYIVGNPIKITASIEDSFLDSPVAPEYIYGVAMQVTAENPAGVQSSFTLYDDGLHGDGGVNDGVYANSFSNTSLEGDYKFDLLISGNTNRDGQPFTREKSLFVRAINPPVVVSSLRASVSPTNYYNVNYTVDLLQKSF